MKKTLTLLSMLIFLGVGSAQTTQEEYNYLTKGYKIQVESGLDMKDGYTLKPIEINTNVAWDRQRSTTFHGLYRDGDKTPCAILMIYTRIDTRFTEHFCIPHTKSSILIWNQFGESLKRLDSSIAGQVAVYGVAQCAAYFAIN
jgi:hypothetical protein